MKETPYHLKRREILFSVFDKFPDLSVRGTALILFTRYPEYFKDLEDARGLVRAYRGVRGEKNRQMYKIKKYYRNETSSMA